MDDNFSDEIKEIINVSKEIAFSYNNDELHTSHLILALIKHAQTDAFRVVLSQQHGLKSAIEKIVDTKHMETRPRNLSLTRQAERAFKTTYLEAKVFQQDVVDCFHLLLCILRNENDNTTKLLHKNKIDYNYVKDIYINYLEKKKSKEILEEKIKYEASYEIYYSTEKDSQIKSKKYRTSFERFFEFDKFLNQDAKISFLRINQISDEELFYLPKFEKLIELEIYNSNIHSFEPFSELFNLQSLTINNTKLQSIEKITELKNLVFLDLSTNQISDISSLLKLNKLKFLDISKNNISNIEPISKNIRDGMIAFFDNNKISSVSETFFLNLFSSKCFSKIEFIQTLKNNFVKRQAYENAAKLRDLERGLSKSLDLKESDLNWLITLFLNENFKNNPIQSPPLEIILEGLNDIKDYFLQVNRDKKQTHLYEGKLLILGEGGTGKTSFARKLEDINALLPTDKETTFNIDIKKIEYNIGEDMQSKMFINMWDFGGQKIYRGTHQLFFSEKCLYVLLDDNREEKTDFSYWLNTIQQIGGNESKLVIVINQKFGRKNISFDEIGYKKQFPIVNDVIAIDLLEDKDELNILKDLIKVRFRELPLIGNPLPSSWVEIRQELSTISQNYISYEKFIEICKKHSINDVSIINTICSYFENIGVIIHYGDDPILKERIYLNSNWLVETIYEVLDNEIIDNSKGIISYNDVKKIWLNNDLDLEIDRLCALMNKFGLMYPVIDTDKFVIPEKLPKKMPYDRWEHIDENLLKFKYEFEKYNPKGMMSKLIVSLNKYIKNQNHVWHRGINIEYENTFAEIIETYSTNNSFEIKISGKNKTGLLAIIIDKFDEILKPYKNLNYEKYVQCNCDKCISNIEPHYFEYSDLIKRREKGVIDIECKKDYEKVSVACLLQGIEISKEEMKKINIFLASSNELKEDREQLEIFINRENKKLIEDKIFLNLNIWEDFIDSMSQTRLQDEYNKVAINSDIFISLFCSKVGMYTEEEFEVAHKNFTEKGTPKHIYTFFKNDKKGMNEININDFQTLHAFKEKLNGLGHFPTNYEDTNDLIKQLKQQFDKILINI